MEVFSEKIFEQRPEGNERMSQTDIWQKQVQAKGRASFCLGTGTSLLVQNRVEGSLAGALSKRRKEGMRLRRWAKVRSYKVLKATMRRRIFYSKKDGESKTVLSRGMT